MTQNVTPLELDVKSMFSKALKNGYIRREDRKKILLLSDDLRLPSGVGNMSREIVLGTAHVFNWVQLGAALNHPEVGKIVDASESLGNDIGISDAYCRIYPYNGYGDQNILRQLIQIERPDAILHFTDPRYWTWLYEMEHEIRTKMPIMFYHVWDDLPFPKYNEPYYRSCDYIANISRQTYNIVRQVWKKNAPADWQIEYIPHGINQNVFKKPTSVEDLARVQEIRGKLFNNEDVDFVIFYNNRNIRRKMTGDVIMAARELVLGLPKSAQDRVRLLMHTQPVDDNGTDLIRLINDVAPELKVVFSTDRVSNQTINDLYAASDVVINLASNEGFGLGTAEALMAEKMIIVNVTGGLQDQCGFKNEAGEYIHEDREYNEQWGSNHDGRFKDHGEWVIPVFPVSRALIGSPPTPYIFDDRCSWEDAAVALRTVYDMPAEERARRGALGREYLIDSGFTADTMNQKFIDGINMVLSKWTPRKRFTLSKSL